MLGGVNVSVVIRQSGPRDVYKTRPRRALVYLSTSTQPCILPGLLNRVPASAGVNAGMSITYAGWQVTLCDPI